jgi:RecA-family ATPase
MRWESRVGTDNILMEFDQGGRAALTTLFNALEGAAIEFGAKLAILDTAADIFGGNENIRPQVRQFISSCLGKLARAIGGAVILCAHPSRAGLSTGEGDGASTAWNNGVRSRLYLSRVKEDEPHDDGARLLTRKKANYASAGETIDLRWEAGVFINKRPPAGIFASFDKHAGENAFLAALDELSAQNRVVNASTSGTNYAPRVMKQMPQVNGFKVGDLAKAMERLLAERKITLVNDGPPSRGKMKIVRAPI